MCRLVLSVRDVVVTFIMNIFIYFNHIIGSSIRLQELDIIEKAYNLSKDNN